MKSQIIDFFKARFSRKERLSHDERRVFLNTQLTCLTAILVSGIASQFHFSSGMTSTAYQIAALGGVSALALIYTAVSRHTRFVTRPLIVLLSFAGMYALTIGSEKTNVSLWLLILPPVIMFNLGLRRGLILVTGLFLLSSLILLYPIFPAYSAYSATYKIRYLSVLFCTIFFSCGIEYSRYKIQQRLQHITEKLQQQACSDPLTNLANRRHMYDLMRHERARSRRHGIVYSLVLADIDNFKHVNDIYGHNAGDAAITHTAKTFTRHLRQEDYIARWGGEEFLLLLANTGAQEANAVTERIRTTLMNSKFLAGDQELSITASFGIYTNDPFSKLEKSIDQEIHEADMCLYKAKQTGKNKTVQYRAFTKKCNQIQTHSHRTEKLAAPENGDSTS
ncbi:GGDEF domain-containing protein [Sansalvadorimonas sp. 2012CJ34-2]|uniref:diguanylate cyclase n=1 Tax=Parendozoicomonas callyspongiae TaxID=2942213 RepID=A0ABT0PHP7_9GAMM|nr:GGDEF domain-containing protein [Sansalvadorimonas sp. 2012CJ34-2]MCL6270894.1 GGDEF domain-containing protein [Sansalvadorimonas sp. 2012CJ34-2]